MNSEQPFLCTAQTELDNHGAAAAEEPTNWVDHRVLKRFIRLHYLYCFTPYMNCKANMESFAQVKTLYRVQTIYKAKRFRTVQHNDITAQFKASISVLKYEVKFLSLIGDWKWQDGMQKIMNNILQSTKLEDKVTWNKGSRYTVIYYLRATLYPVDRGLLDHCDAALHSKPECNFR